LDEEMQKEIFFFTLVSWKYRK